MTEHQMLESMAVARSRLTALRARLAGPGAGPRPQEIVSALADLHELLEELQARYQLLSDILDRTHDVVFAKDRDGRYVMINPQGAALFGKAMAEILGEDDRGLLQRLDAERIMASDREVMRTGVPRVYEETLDIRGVPTSLLTTTSVWHDDARTVRGVIGIAQNVTESRRSERDVATQHGRMRSMAAEIVIREERLRRSLAAELHQGLGQDIALAKLKLSKLRDTASTELHDSLGKIEQLVEQADRSLRSITFQISPPSLHDLGLVAALQWLFEDLGSRYGIEVEFAVDGAADIADERVRVILFRAVRELLINAATHANVRSVTVHLDRLDDRVRITVEDAGAGFASADGGDAHGVGLPCIRAQLEYVHGSMHIDSALDRGTKVTLTAPVSTPVRG